eukprot:m.19169 g.19169  ORF g.19169 m.19169 type:complete len:212 (+) comp12361_c0_seq1:234-869(+)
MGSNLELYIRGIGVRPLGVQCSVRYAPMTGYENAGDGPSNDGSIQVFPLKYKLIPEVLREAGYKTTMIGKWHLGYVTTSHTPEARGFGHYLGYLTGAEDYYTHTKSVLQQCPDTVDLWQGQSHSNGYQSGPANNSKYFPQYSTFFFTDFLTARINDHARDQNESTPFFAYAAYQSVHGPLEVPKRFFDLYTSQGKIYTIFCTPCPLLLFLL